MIKVKKKVCDSCESLTFIWKNYGGMRWCKQCWSCHKAEGVKKPTTSTIRHSSARKQKKDNEYSKLRKR